MTMKDLFASFILILTTSNKIICVKKTSDHTGRHIFSQQTFLDETDSKIWLKVNLNKINDSLKLQVKEFINDS